MSQSEPDPMSKVEEAHAWISFGKQGVLVYRGAREEGADHMLAMEIVKQLFYGIFAANKTPPEEES